MAEKDKAEKKPELEPAVHPNRMKLAEHAFRMWRLIVTNPTTVEDLKRPEFYAHLARQWKPGDLVQVMPDNRSFFAELLVIDASSQYAKVDILRHKELEKVQPGKAMLPGYSIEYAGDHEQWRVIRESDRKVLKSGHATQGDAYSWASNHAKALAA
jgi:hypothetical protein